MRKGEQLSKMIALATSRHDGQFDRGGSPYILHPLKVMHYLRTDDEELMCIALGHDVLEDGFASIAQGVDALRHHGFSGRIIDGILALTKVEGEPYEEYKARLTLPVAKARGFSTPYSAFSHLMEMRPRLVQLEL